MIIRKVKSITKQKKALIYSLQRECLPFDVPLKISNGQWWWIVYDNNTPIAFACLSQSINWCNVGYLSRVGVVESHRGKGIQKLLIKRRLLEARKRGFEWVITDTTHNPASANSLISCGFKNYIPKKKWANRSAIYWIKSI